MINNNKILTVSYGTFSCTLEGFDDSFGTMKAIAEYFRDLSADDRYFGAEPAQPDAQMLARIAEREISRNVEAREDRGRIVLSAQAPPQMAAAVVAADAVDDVAEAIADATVAKADAQEVEAVDVSPEEAPVPESEVHKPTLTVTDPEPVADDATMEADDESVQAESEPVVAAEPEAAQPAAWAPTGIEQAERDIVPSLPDEDVEAFFADSTSGEIEDDALQDDVEEEVMPAQDRAKADSIADKLKRIRAVVSQQGDAVAAPDYSEDQHADATVSPAIKITDIISEEEVFEDEEDTSESVLADTLRDLEDALDADDEAEAAHDDIDGSYGYAESEDDDIAAILNRLDNEADTAEDTSEDDEAEGDYLTQDEDDDMGGNILAAMDTVEAALDDTDLADENLFEDEHTADTAEASEPEIEMEAAAPVAEHPAPIAPRARVLKVKRATLEAAIQSGQLEEYDEDEEDAAPVAPPRKAPLAARSTLSDEAEEALARELAELEADMDAGHQEKSGDALEIEVEADPAPRARIDGSADEDFSRLMEESDQQMEEPEAATRRDAFAHLRAAVAAKKADEAVGDTDEDIDTDEAYRDDLASVVRPRRPASSERARTERPVEQRPAPLKLVAEQRIDTGELTRVTPVRPRRVAAVAQPSASQAEDFADFADEMGATKLPDLLEAAAAYLSFVEGHQNFSRPQLMTKVRQVEKENFTREDSLRSFGKLLREGKIEKMKGGRFQASDQIGFKPAKRAAG